MAIEAFQDSNMKQFLLIALVGALALALVYSHPLEEQRLTLEDADAQPVNDEGAGIRAARHFGGGFGGFGGRGGGGFCCGGGGGGYRRGGGGFGGGYPGGGFGGGYPGGGYGSASASASASASSSGGYYGK
ncbi:glycine-rich cell wall structural protein [Drosophila miranda]|uniref:glycine-rich cell wall structural protein n=1 Tax=Drosophila miranda TaxID=7229 RepID=UPI00143F556A|nr:glycine-rich cell wall structural protein [Drosophila miranda]